ncbi:MAG: hypothetical protein MZU97_12410 [Bacillus subtilis]|nr:hypothetical protein [Bacillus subtilis]
MREAVRNSNVISEIQARNASETGGRRGIAKASDSSTQVEVIATSASTRAGELSQRDARPRPESITPRVRHGVLIDVMIRQIKYSDELTDSVYNRMIKERNQIAQAFRSFDGEGKKAELAGQAGERAAVHPLRAPMTESETIKGKADAEATQIYARYLQQGSGASSRFWRALESYQADPAQVQQDPVHGPGLLPLPVRDPGTIGPR